MAPSPFRLFCGLLLCCRLFQQYSITAHVRQKENLHQKMPPVVCTTGGMTAFSISLSL